MPRYSRNEFKERILPTFIRRPECRTCRHNKFILEKVSAGSVRWVGYCSKDKCIHGDKRLVQLLLDFPFD